MTYDQIKEIAEKMIDEKTHSESISKQECVELMLKFGMELGYAIAKIPLRRDIVGLSHAYKQGMDEYVNPIKFKINP